MWGLGCGAWGGGGRGDGEEKDLFPINPPYPKNKLSSKATLPPEEALKPQGAFSEICIF